MSEKKIKKLKTARVVAIQNFDKVAIARANEETYLVFKPANSEELLVFKQLQWKDTYIQIRTDDKDTFFDICKEIHKKL